MEETQTGHGLRPWEICLFLTFHVLLHGPDDLAQVSPGTTSSCPWQLVFSKVAANTELANNEPWLPRERQGQVPRNLWSQPFINRLIHYLIVCVCVFKDTLVCTVDSLTMKSWPTAKSLMPKGRSFNTHIFFIRHIWPSCSQGQEQHFSTTCHMGVILNHKITKKSTNLQNKRLPTNSRRKGLLSVA